MNYGYFDESKKEYVITMPADTVLQNQEPMDES